MMTDATDALVRRDTTLAQAVIVADKRLDLLQREIEERSVLLIARRQPLAIDLRETISGIRVSGDLERIGDLAKNIAKRVVAISDQAQPQKIVLGVQHMSDLVQEQLKDVLDAYASRDVTAAREVWERDSAIDALYNSLFRELLTYMMEDPRNISAITPPTSPKPSNTSSPARRRRPSGPRTTLRTTRRLRQAARVSGQARRSRDAPGSSLEGRA
jgi:phosphate transport system protein